MGSWQPTAEAMTEALLELGIVDTHYHVGPELIPRKYDLLTLAEVAAPCGATLVLKNHTYATTPLAALARRHRGVRFIGSVVLNRFVGGLNPDAVLGALSGNRTDPAATEPAVEPPIVVWMPTIHAVSHLRTLGHGFDPRWAGCCQHCGDAEPERHPVEEPVVAFDEALRPRPELLAVLELIAAHGACLATGHLHASEIERLVPLALEMGVARVIITHPDYPAVALNDQQLRRLVQDPRVFIEHCFAVHTIEQVPMQRFADSIRATGPEQVVIASDFGQIHSPPFPEGTVQQALALQALLRDQFDRDTFLALFGPNGARALALTSP